jgi:peptidoglycan hydrolase-like protein with peptidoglycan-binding domain
MDGGYDAAFGPMGGLSAVTRNFTSDEVKEIQRALNLLGYGPLEVDGILGEKTTAAVNAFDSTRGVRVGWGNPFALRDGILAAAAKQKSDTTQHEQPVKLPPVAQPFYKNPWVLGTVALAAVAGYIAWRASGKSAGAVSGHDDEPERRERRGRKPKRSLGDEKCGRSPMAGFEEGEAVELETPDYAEKVED